MGVVKLLFALSATAGIAWTLADFHQLREVREYYPDGSLASVYTVDSQDRIHGHLLRYHEGGGGVSFEGHFDHGQWTVCRHFMPDGQLCSEMEETSTLEIVVHQWDEDGNPR
jgi:antitoxin component YwqK of YwqJK toxin-antitoxin module